MANRNANICLGLKAPGSYDALDDKTGLPIVGKIVAPGDAIVGRMVDTMEPYTGKSDKKPVQKHWFRDNSDINMTEHTYIITAVTMTTSGTSAKVVHVTMQTLLVPLIGDKGSDADGQKGVMAKISPPCRMKTMICRSGHWRRYLRPDLLMGPHAIPSRLTIGQEVESCNSLELIGVSQEKIDGIGRGEFECIDGATGKKLQKPIFMGVVDYFTLEHYATKNANNRTKGAIDMRTHQPVKGKINNGGVRWGYMEVADLHVHGVTSILREIMLLNSDPALFEICRGCGLFVTSFVKYCGVCKRDDLLVSIVLPYTLFLTAMEWYAAGIALRFVFESSGANNNHVDTGMMVVSNLDNLQHSLPPQSRQGNYNGGLAEFMIGDDIGVALRI